MNQTVTLLVPEAPVPPPAMTAARRTLARSGVRLGVLENGKANAGHLLRFLVEGIKAAVPVASVVMLRKSRPSEPAPKEILDQLTAEADCVVSAMAD